MPLRLRALAVGPMKNFAYLVGSTATRDLLVVDPAWDVDAIVAAAAGWDGTVRHAVASHTHPDHVNGVPALLDRSPARVHVHKLESPRLALWLGHREVVATDAGDTLQLGDVTVRFLHTPGHTPGSQCLLLECPGEPPHLVSGDTLFIGTCGRCDLPGGDAELLYSSLTQTLGALPERTVLLPGHDYGPTPTSTLGEQRRLNPYLNRRSAADFVELRMRPRAVPRGPA